MPTQFASLTEDEHHLIFVVGPASDNLLEEYGHGGWRTINLDSYSLSDGIVLSLPQWERYAKEEWGVDSTKVLSALLKSVVFCEKSPAHAYVPVSIRLSTRAYIISHHGQQYIHMSVDSFVEAVFQYLGKYPHLHIHDMLLHDKERREFRDLWNKLAGVESPTV